MTIVLRVLLCVSATSLAVFSSGCGKPEPGIPLYGETVSSVGVSIIDGTALGDLDPGLPDFGDFVGLEGDEKAFVAELLARNST